MVHKQTSEEESWLLEEDQHFVHEEQKPGSEVYKQHPGVAPPDLKLEKPDLWRIGPKGWKFHRNL